jgi:hypothetical protein
MSTITQNSNIGSLTRNTGSKVNASLRTLICASLAMAITSLTAQVIANATSASQSTQGYSAVSAQATATLPAITVAAAR